MFLIFINFFFWRAICSDFHFSVEFRVSMHLGSLGFLWVFFFAFVFVICVFNYGVWLQVFIIASS